MRRSTREILDDLRTIDFAAVEFNKSRYDDLVAEWKRNFELDCQELDGLNALPYVIKHKWTDTDLADMANDILVLKTCAEITVCELFARGRSRSTVDFFAIMKYHADAYRLFGFDERYFPYSFSVESDLVAEAIIQTCKEKGETKEDVIARFSAGFDEFAELIRRPVMKKMGVLDGHEPSFVRLIHPRVALVSMRKFQDGYYADAVESAFKELNNAVKEKVRPHLEGELDGQKLMQRVFSPGNPILLVEDNLDTQTNRDTQQGYMMMFSGAMGAIRNPKAHENMVISQDDAIRKLMLASMLMYKLDSSHFVVQQR